MCTVGSEYQQYNEVPNPQGWYLNTQLPATCSGNVTGYTAYHYNITTQETELVLVLAMWIRRRGNQNFRYRKVLINIAIIWLDFLS